jgi:hypothetical protein
MKTWSPKAKTIASIVFGLAVGAMSVVWLVRASYRTNIRVMHILLVEPHGVIFPPAHATARPWPRRAAPLAHAANPVFMNVPV